MIATLPGAHPLQTWEWGQVKAQFGWRPLPQVWRSPQGDVIGAALVLQRRIPLRGLAARLSVLYVPKGPLCDWSDPTTRQVVLTELRQLAQRQGAIFIKIDPDLPVGRGVPGEAGAVDFPLGQVVQQELHRNGWHFSSEQVQFRNTVRLDLRLSEEQLLANMKQKTRYNIRLAERKGVQVRQVEEGDLPLLYRMYAETSVRDGFVIREQQYYLTLWQQFLRAGLAEGLLASVADEAVAGLMILHFNGLAIYLNGMSRQAHREKMPNYLLQWRAVQRLQQLGCHTYDLWGAPEVFAEGDPLWGVYRFKEGFGGQVVRMLGAWDLPTRPLWYWLYTRLLPRVLDWMRRRGKAQTRRQVTLEAG